LTGARSEGITRDFRKHARQLLGSDLPVRAKVGLVHQGLVGLQGLALILFWLLLPTVVPGTLPLLALVGLLVVLGVMWGWPVLQGARYEGYGWMQVASILLYAFVLSYALAVTSTYAFVSGLVRDPTSWAVTRRRA